MCSIADRDKTEALEIIKDLAEFGYGLAATSGTADMLEEAGLKVKTVAAKIGEGHPDSVELIKQGEVVAVINTITGRRRPLLDGFEIRRAAVENGVPCFTSLDTARAAVSVLQSGEADYNIKPLGWYRQKQS